MTVASVDRSWDRIDAWLAEHAPRTYESLRPPATAEAVRALGDELGLEPPADLVRSLLRHDGVTRESAGAFLIPSGDLLLGVDRLLETGRMHKELWGEEGSQEIPDEDYWHPEFLMFTRRVTADGLVLDCRRGPRFGAVGLFFNSGGTTFRHWASLAVLLHELADSLESGSPLACGKADEYVPIAWDGELIWEPLPVPRPALRSLLELGASATAPAPPDIDGDRVRPVKEEGWAGEYGEFCLSFVRGVDEREVLSRFGALTDADGPRTRPRTREQAYEDSRRWTSGFLPVVRAGRCGDWAFGIEQGHWEGSRSEVMRRLSRGTQAVSIFFRGHFTEMSWYEDGELVTVYDTRRSYRMPGEGDPFSLLPGLPPHSRHASRRLADGRVLLGRGVAPDEADATTGPRAICRKVCQVVADHFGIDLPPESLTGPLTSATLLPVLPAPQVGRLRPTGLEDRMAAASEPRLRTALAAQMAALATETGLDAYPEVTDVLNRLHREGQELSDGDTGDESPLGVRLRTVLADTAACRHHPMDENRERLVSYEEYRAWENRAAAATALLGLLRLPPRDAAADILIRRQDPYWRAEFATQLKADRG
ncbi:DUF6461 domain-containing protein [Streptomyces sp. NPDC001780]